MGSWQRTAGGFPSCLAAPSVCWRCFHGKKMVNDVQMTPVRTSGGNFLDHSSSSFRQRLQQLGQERADPRSNRVSWVMAWEKTYEPAVGLPAICVRRYQTRRARILGGPGYRHFICLHSRSAEESSANKAINSGPANRMNFRLLGKSGLKLQAFHMSSQQKRGGIVR